MLSHMNVFMLKCTFIWPRYPCAGMPLRHSEIVNIPAIVLSPCSEISNVVKIMNSALLVFCCRAELEPRLSSIC